METQLQEFQVPYLRKGKGGSPERGGCIMQVLDWIERGTWTDEPPSVHPVIRRVAIAVNDNVDEEQRQRLLDLGPRMRNTWIGFADWRVNTELEKWLVRVVGKKASPPTVELLIELLDLYDALTGRGAPTEPLDLTDFPEAKPDWSEPDWSFGSVNEFVLSSEEPMPVLAKIKALVGAAA